MTVPLCGACPRPVEEEHVRLEQQGGGVGGQGEADGLLDEEGLLGSGRGGPSVHLDT